MSFLSTFTSWNVSTEAIRYGSSETQLNSLHLFFPCMIAVLLPSGILRSFKTCATVPISLRSAKVGSSRPGSFWDTTAISFFDLCASEINLINTLFKNIREITNDEIENIVKSKVIELAEDVIGYQIEKFPDKFLKKIKNNINEIKNINSDIKIYLNDQDLELVNKIIDKNKAEINFKLDLDTSLGRGDFTIDMGGVVQAIKYKKVIE